MVPINMQNSNSKIPSKNRHCIDCNFALKGSGSYNNWTCDAPQNKVKYFSVTSPDVKHSLAFAILGPEGPEFKSVMQCRSADEGCSISGKWFLSRKEAMDKYNSVIVRESPVARLKNITLDDL